MNIQPRRLVGSVMAAVALMLCLGLGLVGVMVLGRGEDAVKAVKEVAQDTDCQFTACVRTVDRLPGSDPGTIAAKSRGARW